MNKLDVTTGRNIKHSQLSLYESNREGNHLNEDELTITNTKPFEEREPMRQASKHSPEGDTPRIQ